MARPPRDNDRLGTSSWKPFFLQEPKVLGLGWGLGWWVRVNERKLLSEESLQLSLWLLHLLQNLEAFLQLTTIKECQVETPFLQV
jgi:hypothetical protein